MNANLWQTILTILVAISSLAATILVSLGCTQTVTGGVDCSGVTGSWAPWLAIAATVLSVVKLIVKAFQDGGLTGPTQAK